MLINNRGRKDIHTKIDFTNLIIWFSIWTNRSIFFSVRLLLVPDSRNFTLLVKDRFLPTEGILVK